MGSTCSDHPDLLGRIAHLIDEAHQPADVHLAAYLEVDADDPGALVLGVRRFDEHPTDVDWSLEVQDSWWALVLCVRGRAHFLDEPDHGPEPIVSTFARSRDGSEVSLLRRRGVVTLLPERAVGRIPDLLRMLLPAPARARP
jgi:hypothetical protein